jgi:putative transcriptional regulator
MNIASYKLEVVHTQVELGRCRVKELLKRANMTQLELAEETGLSKKYINDKINNRGPRGMTLSTAKKIAMVLGCTIDELYDWKIHNS